MTHAAKILRDSISPHDVRLTTFEVTLPRIVLAEFNTHRQFSRNSASSRAIPVEKMLRMVRENPYIPTHWGKNQKGMQADIELTLDEQVVSETVWLNARDRACEQVEKLLAVGVHKQITNRLLEPFMWHTIICTATELDNFFHLRNNAMAHPDIQIPARLMREALAKSTPDLCDYGMYHLPLIVKEDGHVLYDEHVDFEFNINVEELGEGLWWQDAIKLSVARCARVSYLTHEGKRDPAADYELYNRLLEGGHLSPFEHVARPMGTAERRSACAAAFDWTAYGSSAPTWLSDKPFCGNFHGWVQYRKTIPREYNILG